MGRLRLLQFFFNLKTNAMKFLFEKRSVLLSASAVVVAGFLATASLSKATKSDKKTVKCCNNPDLNHVCIMKTILGIDTARKEN